MSNRPERLDDWSDRIHEAMHRAGAFVLGAALTLAVLGYTWSYLR